jgi:hypothetical protein
MPWWNDIIAEAEKKRKQTWRSWFKERNEENKQREKLVKRREVIEKTDKWF